MIQLYTIYKRFFNYKDTNMLKVQKWKNIFQVDNNQERAEMAIPSSNKTFLKSYKR